MSTLSPGTAAASWPPSMRTSVAVSTGAAALAGVLAAGVVWASQLWWLPWENEGHPGDLAEWDPEGTTMPKAGRRIPTRATILTAGPWMSTRTARGGG
jgi:hypothetical protein